MQRRKLQSFARKAEALQVKVDAKIKEQAGLLSQAATLNDFQEKAGIHRQVWWIERDIEQPNRKIRRLQVKANPPAEPMLWGWATPANAAKPPAKKGGR